MSEVKCSTCKGVGQLEFERGQRRVPCVTCSGTGIDWRKSCEAQRLRADTAEAEVARLRETATLAAKVGAPNFHSLKRELAAVEQRIAAHESMLRHFANCADRFQVGTIAMDYVAALNPNPEAPQPACDICKGTGGVPLLRRPNGCIPEAERHE